MIIWMDIGDMDYGQAAGALNKELEKDKPIKMFCDVPRTHSPSVDSTSYQLRLLLLTAYARQYKALSLPYL